ncbi:MAG TPA: glycosyltransferase [Allosphingosinicella sp.]|jgi:glycosyltransferase involved in cell wall biosynthesis|nr:glycosyltransferase [Allosphingosinicella sp.]
MHAPLVTAILPVFDRAGSIGRAIESVLDQSYAPVELILVDDGSTDGTAHILERYRDRATLLKQENRGAYAARNLALRHAKGELVAFIDSDDAWLPDKLARQVPLMRGDVGLVYGDVVIVAEPRDDAPRTGRTSFTSVTPRRGRALQGLAAGNFVPTCTALVRTSALEEIGLFPEESRISADYLTWFRIAKRHSFDFVPDPVALYTLHEAGISHDLGRSLAARIRLFQGERARTDDPETRRILDRLLFNLGLHLALAAVRGRAKAVERPLALAGEAMAPMDSGRALWSTAAFAANQTRLRARRLLP